MFQIFQTWVINTAQLFLNVACIHVICNIKKKKSHRAKECNLTEIKKRKPKCFASWTKYIWFSTGVKEEGNNIFLDKSVKKGQELYPLVQKV